tara:strand:+ start:2292 stop:3254 length:963 start_codon:yes stop_codon:yes gene_type:complete
MVSIIIPNYNKSKYIEETISSVLKQDYKDWECIIIDDFSSDNSVSIISRLINNEKRLHLIKNLSNKGANFSRNLGLKKSKGDFIIFLDADDVLNENCLKSRVEILLTEPDLKFAVFPVGTFYNFLGDNDFIWNNFRGIHLDRFLYHDLPWLICSVIWERNTIVELEGFNPSFNRMQDVELHSRALVNNKIIYKTFPEEKTDVYYRINNEKITDKFNFCINDIKSKFLYIESFNKLLSNKNINKNKFLSGTIFECYNLVFNFYSKGFISNKQLDYLLDYILKSNVLLNRRIFSKTFNFLYLFFRRNNIYFFGMNKFFKRYF